MHIHPHTHTHMIMTAGVYGEERTTATNSSADARARFLRARQERCGAFSRADGLFETTQGQDQWYRPRTRLLLRIFFPKIDVCVCVCVCVYVVCVSVWVCARVCVSSKTTFETLLSNCACMCISVCERGRECVYVCACH